MFAAVSTALMAVGQIKVEYDDKTLSLPEVMRQYLTVQGAQSRSVTLKGNFNGKRGKIKKVVCDNGNFSEKELFPEFMHFILTDSIETLDFMAVPKGENKLILTCFYPITGAPLFSDTLDLDKNHILMETHNAGNEADSPIISYSSGIMIESEIGPISWYCGLRDSGTPPREWNEKHGIDNYVYYTISLEDDTPAGKNDPIYYRVAKENGKAVHRH